MSSCVKPQSHELRYLMSRMTQWISNPGPRANNITALKDALYHVVVKSVIYSEHK